eukprot:684916-Amorphochlora_amoeboformis.AAC.2
MSAAATKDQKTGDKKDDEKKAKEIQNLVDEDDEFEEFPKDTWDQKEEDNEDEKLWEDNWDDDDLDENFTEQLREEISKGIGRLPMQAGCKGS